MKKYIFSIELHKEYQKEGYKHYGIKLIIVAGNEEAALEKLSSYEVSHGKIHFYSSNFKVVDLHNEREVSCALKEEKESINSLNQSDSQGLGLLIGAIASCIVETNMCKNPIKNKNKLNKILLDESIHRILEIT